MPRHSEEQERLLALAAEQFAFLAGRGARRKRVHESSNTTLAYLFPDVAFELDFDWFDRLFYVMVSRPTDGKLPASHLRDRATRRFLGELLRTGPPRDVPLADRIQESHSRRSDEAALAERVTANADVLRECLDEILKRGVRIFDPPSRTWRADTPGRRLP